MKILRVDDPYLKTDDYGYIYHTRMKEKESPNPDLKKTYPVTFIRLNIILEYIDKHYDSQMFLGKVEIPALARMIRNEILTDVCKDTARNYAIFLRELPKYRRII